MGSVTTPRAEALRMGQGRRRSLDDRCAVALPQPSPPCAWIAVGRVKHVGQPLCGAVVDQRLLGPVQQRAFENHVRVDPAPRHPARADRTRPPGMPQRNGLSLIIGVMTQPDPKDPLRPRPVCQQAKTRLPRLLQSPCRHVKGRVPGQDIHVGKEGRQALPHRNRFSGAGRPQTMVDDGNP